MNIKLKTMAANGELQQVQITVSERLPGNIEGPCNVDCEYKVQKEGSYYLLTLATSAQLTIICQRCLNKFPYDYANQTVLAVCESDEQATKLMSQYDCVTSNNEQVDLSELLADELYLYTTSSHPDLKDCDADVSGFIISS